jgi:hypothetical protein
MIKKLFLFILFVVLLTISAVSQNKPLNIPNFTKSRYHWGFWLGYTQSSLVPTRKADFDFNDSLGSLTPVSIGSFAVGPMGSISFTENIKMRLAILLSFQDRNMEYVFLQDGARETYLREVRSVYTEFPLQLKLVTNRINNVAFYGTLGGKYGVDWSSNINVKEQFDYKDVLKIKRSNVAMSVGGGVDFFLQYFKFGIDLRLDMGINNVLVPNKTYFSSPLEKLRTQMWQLSFTFEG